MNAAGWRILHVLPTRDRAYGGPIRVAEALATQAQRAGAYAELFPEPGRKRTIGRSLYWPGVSGMAALARSVRAATLVHIHGLWTLPTSAAGLFAQRFEVPYVVTPHGMLDRWSRQHSRTKKRAWAMLLENRVLSGAAGLHFFNDEERSEALELGLTAQTFVLPNGVEAEDFRGLPDRGALEARWPATRGKTVVLFLGRLHPKKGLPVLVEALAHAAEPSLHTLIAGPDEGGHRAEVEQLVTRRGLRNAVTFTGEAEGEDKRVLLGGADLFVLPSQQEGDSIAIKEALAAGLPVLITPECHQREVDEWKAGLVLPRTAETFARGLRQLAADPRARAEMSAQAQKLVEAKFRWATLGARLLAEYARILELGRDDAGQAQSGRSDAVAHQQ